LIGVAAMIIRSGIDEGTFRNIGPVAAGRALVIATTRFTHPAHAAEWSDPDINAAFDDVWQMLTNGLCVPNRPAKDAAALKTR
jgi:hypothetical protein